MFGSTRFHRRVASVCLAWTILTVGTPLTAQILPLVSESLPEEVAFWWMQPDRLQMTAFDSLLLEQAHGLLIDARALSGPPLVSRIYRAADLSVTNARNLAGLYGARQVLVGGITLGSAVSLEGEVFWIVQADLECQLVSVDVEIVYFQVTRRFVGQGSDRASAYTSAREQAARFLSGQLRRVRQGPLLAASPQNLEIPTLLIRGLHTARPLVAFEGDLRRQTDLVVDVREGWISEGLIALEVDIVPGCGMDDLETFLGRLAEATDTDYQLLVEDRDGLAFEIRLSSRETTQTDQLDETQESEL